MLAQKRLFALIFCVLVVSCADKEEWKKRSIYQLLTDRFARNDGQGYGCDNLGISLYMKGTIVEEATKASPTTWTTFRVWASMLSGFPLSLTTEMEVTMVIGQEICML